MARKDNTPVDERGAIEVLVRDPKALKVHHGLELVEDFGEHLLPAGEALTSPLAFINGYGEGERAKQALGQRLGLDNWHEARRSRALMAKLNHLSQHKWHRLGGAAASTAGAFAGVAALSWLGGPVTGVAGTLAGLGAAAVGGMGAGIAYNKTIKSKDQDSVELVAQVFEAQHAKAAVPAEVVFAALAAKMPGKAGKAMANDLKKLTKTRYFTEAVADQKMEALNVLMHKYDKEIRIANGMPIDAANPDKTVAEQFADLINSGRLDARELVLNRSSTATLAELERQKLQAVAMASAPSIPSSPEMQRLAQNMAGMGIAPVGADVPQDLPKPEGRSLGKA